MKPGIDLYGKGSGTRAGLPTDACAVVRGPASDEALQEGLQVRVRTPEAQPCSWMGRNGCEGETVSVTHGVTKEEVLNDQVAK